MLLSKTVKTRWVAATKTYYMNLGYTFTRMQDEFEVLVEHLTLKSNIRVSVQCDGCGKILDTQYSVYTSKVANNKYYCLSCSIRNYNKSNIYTLEKYCIDNNMLDVIERWDKNLNKVAPDCVGIHTTNKHYFICQNGIHDSEEKNIGNAITYNTFGCSECEKIERNNRERTIYNLAGRQYDMLFVNSYNKEITEVNKTDNRTIHYWNCICNCGNDVIKSENYLINHNSIKSCGCYYEKPLISINLIGDVYGKLTVIEFDNERSKQSREDKTHLKFWFCKCECGNIKSINQMNLTQGKTKSCGCEFYRKHIDMTGEKYGKLTVLERDYSKNTKSVMWKCLCECGNINIVESHCLKRGDSTSCGCYHLERVSGMNNHNWKDGITETHIYLRRALVPWNKYILSLYDNKCVISGSNTDLAVHHIYSFRKILEETFDEANLQVQNTISKYSDSELLLLKSILLKKHYELNCGVPVSRYHHDTFHKTYGYIDTNIEQFLMYLYDNGIYPELIDSKISQILSQQTKSTS